MPAASHEHPKFDFFDLTPDAFDAIVAEFIDGKSAYGPWGFMTPSSWRRHGVGRLGTGFGQRYERQADGSWLKVEG